MAFQPLNTKNSLGSNFGQVNNMIKQLEKEQTVKTFKQSGGNAIVQGRYADGKYGNVFYDSTPDARILIGMAPDDGRMGIWVTKDGFDVVDELS